MAGCSGDSRTIELTIGVRRMSFSSAPCHASTYTTTRQWPAWAIPCDNGEAMRGRRPKTRRNPDERWQPTGAQGKRPAVRTRAERPARHKSCVLSPLSTHRPSLERLPDQPMTGRWQARPHWCVTALRCHGGLTPGCCQADTRRLARTPSMGTLTDRPCSSSRVPSAVRNEDRVKYQ